MGVDIYIYIYIYIYGNKKMMHKLSFWISNYNWFWILYIDSLWNEK